MLPDWQWTTITNHCNQTNRRNKCQTTLSSNYTSFVFFWRHENQIQSSVYRPIKQLWRKFPTWNFVGGILLQAEKHFLKFAQLDYRGFNVMDQLHLTCDAQTSVKCKALKPLESTTGQNLPDGSLLVLVFISRISSNPRIFFFLKMFEKNMNGAPFFLFLLLRPLLLLLFFCLS